MIKASIIIANNIKDYSFPKEVKESWLEVIVVNSTNPCWARNQGAKKAKGKYLVFLDNDVRVKKGFLTQVIKYLDSHPRVGAGQLKLLRWGSKKYDSAGDLLTANGFLAERAREAEDKGQFDKDDYILSGKGAAMLVRKDVFEKVGGFDESYVYYWEEPDLFWRVWRAGFEVRFLWMGMAEHAYGTKLKPIPKVPAEKTVYLSCRNQLMTIIKNASVRRRQMLFWVSLSWLGLEIMFVVKAKWKQAWAIIKALSYILFRSGSSCRSGTEETQQWLDQVLVKKDFKWYAGKGISYILGRPY